MSVSRIAAAVLLALGAAGVLGVEVAALAGASAWVLDVKIVVTKRPKSAFRL
jgi:formate-dependent phosphoribosylglycinamide formyltransferase (GAR transformylase)